MVFSTATATADVNKNDNIPVDSRSNVEVQTIESAVVGPSTEVAEVSNIVGMPLVEDYFEFDFDTGKPRATIDEAAIVPINGYALHEGRSANLYHYKVRLVASPRAEQYRSVLEDVAGELERAGLANLTIVPGLFPNPDVSGTGWTQPPKNEIYFYTEPDSGCGAVYVAGCARAFIGTEETVFSAIAWMLPNTDTYSPEDKRHVVAHEIGHTLGLAHYDLKYLGVDQVMHSSSYSSFRFDEGNRRGLRFLGKKFVSVGGLDSVVSPSAGKVRATGWAYTPIITAGTQVYVYLDAKEVARPVVSLARADIVTGQGLPAGTKPGFDVTFDVSSGQHTVCLSTFNYNYTSSVGLGCKMLNVPVRVDRIVGSDRYSTTVEVSKAAFPGTAGVVFVASGTDFPDALAGGPAASKLGGPLLLTPADALPAVVRAEIVRLKPSKIIIVGGINGVSASIETQLKTLTSGVVRLSGADRYDTSRKIAAYAFPSASTVYIASGTTYPDALASSAAAATAKGPLLLVNGTTATADTGTLNQLVSLKASAVRVVGGEASVTPGIVSSVKAKVGNTIRISSQDRYLSSVAISNNGFSATKRAFVVTGLNFPEGIVAAPLAAKSGSPVYLSNGACLHRVGVWRRMSLF